MKWKNRLTNYNFWLSIVSAVLLILQAFNISYDVAYINEIVTAVLALFVMVGIISDPTKNSGTTDAQETVSENEDPANISDAETNGLSENISDNATIEEISVTSETNKKSEGIVDAVPNIIEQTESSNRYSQVDIQNLINTISKDLEKLENAAGIKNISTIASTDVSSKISAVADTETQDETNIDNNDMVDTDSETICAISINDMSVAENTAVINRIDAQNAVDVTTIASDINAINAGINADIIAVNDISETVEYKIVN